MTDFHLQWNEETQYGTKTNSNIHPLFDKIMILLTASITMYLELNMSLPAYVQAFEESHQAQLLWLYTGIFTAGSSTRYKTK